MQARCLTLMAALLCPALVTAEGLPAGGHGPQAAGDKKADAKPAAGEVLHVFRGALDAKDPPDPLLKKSPHKVHEVKLEAGKVYQIDLMSKDFDAFLRVEDAKGKPLAHDDDSGGGTNARLLFAPKEGAGYRLIVTAYPKGDTSGAYTLTVRLADERTQREQQILALNAAGLQHVQRAEYQAAERLLRKALALCQELYPNGKYPDGHLHLALTRFGLGSVLKAQKKLQEAHAHFQQVVAIHKKVLPPDHSELAVSSHALGLVLRELGKLYEARACLEEALTIRKKTLPKDHFLLAMSLHDVGLLLHDLGRLEEALGYQEQALAIDRKALAPDHPLLSFRLNNLGLVLRDLGKLAEARACLEEALAIRKKAFPHRPLLAESLNNLGGLLRRLGKLEEARVCLEEALAIYKKALPPDDIRLSAGLNNLGLLMRSLGKLEEARSYLEEALPIQKKALPPDHPDLARGLDNLGVVLHDLRKWEEGRDYYERALIIRRKALPADHPLLAVSLSNLGSLLSDVGKREEARGYYEQALAIQKKALPPDHPELADNLGTLGRLAWGMGRHDEGWPLLSAAVTASANFCRRLATVSAQRDHAALIQQQRDFLDRLVSAASEARALSESQRQELLLRCLEGKGISTAALGGRRAALLEDTDPQARARADKLLPLQRRLTDLLLRGPGKLTPQQYRDECASLQKQVDALERELGLQVQAFALLQQAHTATPAALATRLPPGAALVETVGYYPYLFTAEAGKRWGRPRYAAMLLWRGDGGAQVRLLDLGEAAPLEKAIAAWRAAVQQGTTDAKAERALRERLWAPLAKALPEKTQRLVVAPDGALALVPFEAIKLDERRYLIERYAVQYVSTGRDLMPQPLPKERSEVALVLADPDYDRATGSPAVKTVGGADKLRDGLEFKRLPGFAKEADAVAALLKGRAGWRVEQARGNDASEEKLSAVRRPRLLHCVTHGFFLKDVKREPPKDLFRDLEISGAGRARLPNFGQDPRLRSGLALAGANKWQARSAKGLSDGLLTALEVEGLDLWGTELVVLSACETGLGEVQNGEGVLGLRRAFQLAGAQTVLASLWKVPDAETEQLMTDTLSRWLKGRPPHEALRAAQLEMIRRLRQSDDPRRREAPPLYWAAFICHGR